MRLAIIVAAHIVLSACAVSRTIIQLRWADESYSGPPLDRNSHYYWYWRSSAAAELIADKQLATGRRAELLWRIDEVRIAEN